MQALSLDAALLRGPGEPRLRGFVHSVFERVINVTAEDGDLFTLAARDIGNAPWTLIADAEGFREAGIKPGDKVHAGSNVVYVGERLRIHLDGACAWQAELPRYPHDDSRLQSNVAWARQECAQAAFRPAAEADTTAAGDKMAQLIQRRTSMLREALIEADIDSARRHGQALLGLGPGLTPSGDDYLVGLFAVLNMPGSPCAELVPVCAAIVEPARERTHAISVAALRAAARGRVLQPLSSLMCAMQRGSAHEVRPVLDRVLAIGSSSGADMIAGMLDGFDVARAMLRV